jgi:hypothetical protein
VGHSTKVVALISHDMDRLGLLAGHKLELLEAVTILKRCAVAMLADQGSSLEGPRQLKNRFTENLLLAGAALVFLHIGEPSMTHSIASTDDIFEPREEGKYSTTDIVEVSWEEVDE